MLKENETFQDAKESLSRYGRRSERYSERPEEWKEDHAAAMRCFDFEGLLASGLALYDLINRLDEAWRTKVYQNLVPHDPDVDAAIEALYRSWLTPCDRIQAQLSELQKHYEVAGAKEFLAACREVRGILTPDGEFFAHDRLVDLRDAAIDAHRMGETESMGE